MSVPNPVPDPDHGQRDGTERRSGISSTAAVIAVSRIAVRRALAIYRALGISAAAMRDGKIVIIPPHELPLKANVLSAANPDETFAAFVPRRL